MNSFLPVLHRDYFFLQLFGNIDQFQSFLYLAPYVLHIALQLIDRPFCLLYMGLLAVNLNEYE